MINYGIMLVFKSFHVLHSKANANFESVFIKSQKIIFENKAMPNKLFISYHLETIIVLVFVTLLNKLIIHINFEINFIKLK